MPQLKLYIYLFILGLPPFFLSGKSNPHILFIAIDDLRPELGCYGSPMAKSPNLDKLAGEGRRFERAYCQQSICSPSRASLMTGARPDAIGVIENTAYFRDLNPNIVTLPQHFIKNGYEAVYCGKIYHGRMTDDAHSWSRKPALNRCPVKRINLPGGYARTENQNLWSRNKEAMLARYGQNGSGGLIHGPAYESADVPDHASRLRTFECWGGHSYAGGMSSGFDGNNQESSSEAVGSWAGMFFLGAALGDDQMMATGAMGYSIETEAVHEYWNNAYGWKKPGQSNWSANYQPTICSVMRDRDMGAWTWFSGEPIHIYGIQWLPAWTHMNYFGAHAEHSVFQLNQMLEKQGKDKGKMTWEKIDGDWGQVSAAYAAFCQPEEICKVLDEAIEKKWSISSPKHAGIPYYLAHASRAYGLVDKESHTDLPTSIVLKKANGQRTALVYNLTNSPRPVQVYVQGKKVLEGNLPAKVLMAVPLR